MTDAKIGCNFSSTLFIKIFCRIDTRFWNRRAIRARARSRYWRADAARAQAACGGNRRELNQQLTKLGLDYQGHTPPFVRMSVCRTIIAPPRTKLNLVCERGIILSQLIAAFVLLRHTAYLQSPGRCRQFRPQTPEIE
jgi:hypothetical protein